MMESVNNCTTYIRITRSPYKLNHIQVTLSCNYGVSFIIYMICFGLHFGKITSKNCSRKGNEITS